MNGKTSYQIFYIPIGIAIFFLIGGMALGGVLNGGSVWSFFKLSPQLAVVDMQVLIAKRSQHLANNNPNKALGKASKISNQQIQEASEQLKEMLEAFALKHRLILIAKGAVMGGNLPDYTNEIMEDAFRDYTTALMAFIQSRAKNQQSSSFRPEGFRLKSLQPKDQRPEDQENQP